MKRFHLGRLLFKCNAGKGIPAMEYFHITEAQLGESTASYIKCLPKYIQEALERKEAAI